MSEKTEVVWHEHAVKRERGCVIWFTGLSGSGKSTIARRLGRALQIDYVEMDRLFHGPNWTEPSESVFRERITNAISGDRWVLDGNYHSKTYDLKTLTLKNVFVQSDMMLPHIDIGKHPKLP